MAGSRWLTPWWRRLLLLVLTILFATLALFPERYRAATTLTPTDPGSFGLGGALGQLGAVNSVFGNQAAVEVALKVGRSELVRSDVARRLDLGRKLGKNPVAVDRWLAAKVDGRSLRGGIIQLEALDPDPAFARTLIQTYALAMRDRLADIARTQTAYKREVLTRLVSDASDRLARAQSAYDNFRLRTRYSEPTTAIAAIGERIPVIEASIKAKQVQLNAARQFATDDNLTNRQIIAQIEALQAQLAQARATDPRQNASVGRVVQESTQAEKLGREVLISRELYEGYLRFLEGTSVEDLTAIASVRFLEPAYVDTERQYNVLFAVAAMLTLLTALAIEFYDMRRPPGDRHPA